MEEDVTGAAFFFAAARGHLPEFFDVENGGSCLVELGKAPIMMVAPDNFGVTVKTKLGLKAWTRQKVQASVASSARARLWVQNRPPLSVCL